MFQKLAKHMEKRITQTCPTKINRGYSIQKQKSLLYLAREKMVLKYSAKKWYI